MSRHGEEFGGKVRLPWWLNWSKHADDLTAAEREELEARTDPLIDLVGYYERYRPESPAYDDVRFLSHVATERREVDDPLDRLSPSSVVALRDRILETWHARRLGVTLVREAIRREPLEITGPVSGIIEELERAHAAADPDLAIAAGLGRELWDAEVECCVPLPAEIPRGKYVVLRITGDSMLPLLHAGDVVLVKLGSDPAVDSVVVARGSEGGYVAKEVHHASRASLELHSLDPAYAPVRLRRQPGDVLGTVIMRWCSHGQR